MAYCFRGQRWNGPLTEKQIERREFLLAQGITVSRAKSADYARKVRKLMKTMNARKAMKSRKAKKVTLPICGPFAERRLKSMKARKAIAQNNRSHAD